MLEESNLQEHLEAIHGSYGAAMNNEQVIANLMAGPAPHQYVNLEEALIEYNGQDITRLIAPMPKPTVLKQPNQQIARSRIRIGVL